MSASISRGLGAAAIVAVLLADSSIAAAQVHVKNGSGKAAAGLGASSSVSSDPVEVTVSPGPTTSPPFTTTLTTVRRPMDRCRFFFPYWRLGGAFVGDAPLWSYDVTPVLLQAGPPLENTLIGGLQLDVEPRSAQVYVDGAYAGVVSDFSGYYKHLEIAAGPHLVTILALNYEPLTISVMITPGRTITHRGTLTWAYGR